MDTAKLILEMIAAAGLLVGGYNTFLMSQVRLELANLRTDIAERRAKDREELKDWAGAQFQRVAGAP